MRKLFALLFVPAAFLLASCGDDDTSDMQNPSLVQAATDAGLTTLLDAVTAVDGLADELSSAAAITVFAPNNAAFAAALEAYGVTTLDQLVTELGGVENLETVLGFHVVGATAFSSDLSEGDQTFNTLAGQTITVNKTGNVVTVSDAAGAKTVVAADVAIENGVVHVIDGVLLPTLNLPSVVDAATAAGLTTLLDAVTAAELATTLTSAEAITVFAPTNAAFADLLEAQQVQDLAGLIAQLGAANVAKVLQFHVVPAVAFSHDLADGEQMFQTLAGEMITVTKTGSSVTVTDVGGTTYNVSTPDVTISNGVVHVIDGVVLPTLAN